MTLERDEPPGRASQMSLTMTAETRQVGAAEPIHLPGLWTGPDPVAVGGACVTREPPSAASAPHTPPLLTPAPAAVLAIFFHLPSFPCSEPLSVVQTPQQSRRLSCASIAAPSPSPSPPPSPSPSHSAAMEAAALVRSRHGLLLCLLQLVFIVLFGVLAGYHQDADETLRGNGDQHALQDKMVHARIYPSEYSIMRKYAQGIVSLLKSPILPQVE